MADQPDTRVVQLPPQSLRADVVPRTVNQDDRSVEVIITTGTGVRRTDYWTGKAYIEQLSLDPKNIRLDRLNQGAPLLDSHAAYSVADMLGVVVPGSVELTKTAMIGRVRFSKRDAVEPVWQDVRDGLIRSVSVGYRVYKFEEKPGKTEDAPPVRTAVDWEPFEVSMVPIPADANAKVRGEAPLDANACEIVLAPSPAAPPIQAVRSDAPVQPAEERTMPEKPSETILVPPTLPVPAAPAPAATEPSERDLGAQQMLERVQGIHAACRAARMPVAYEEALIGDVKITLLEAQRRIFEELAKRDVDVPRGSSKPVQIVGVDDPLVHARAGIANALLHRIAPDRHKLEEIGRPYRGMSVLDIGRAFLAARGMSITGLRKSELVDAMLGRGGMHSTSDFPYLLADVANKNLRSAYEAAPQTWLPIAQPVSVSDFKASNQLQVGDAPGLDEILEHGEFTTGTITEAREQVTLKTYGKMFAITRQALINDDLNSFGNVPAAFGRKARDKESDLAWAQITSNPTMGDGVALFIAAHNNLAILAAVISVTSLGAGRRQLRKQTGLDGTTLLNLDGRYLIVPAELETLAEQYVTQVTPAQSSNVNPFGPSGRTPLTVIVEPRLDANSTKAWYMACAASQAPVLYYATLEGQSGPDLRQEEGFDIDGLKFRCRLDVGFKAADYRAIYKNSGA